MVDTHVAGQPLVGKVVRRILLDLAKRKPTAVQSQQCYFQQGLRMKRRPPRVGLHLIGFFDYTRIQRIDQVIDEGHYTAFRGYGGKIDLREKQHLVAIWNDECRHEVPPVFGIAGSHFTSAYLAKQ